MSCHVLYCGNAQLGPTEILVSLSFSYSEIFFFLETNLRFYIVGFSCYLNGLYEF